MAVTLSDFGGRVINFSACLQRQVSPVKFTKWAHELRVDLELKEKCFRLLAVNGFSLQKTSLKWTDLGEIWQNAGFSARIITCDDRAEVDAQGGRQGVITGRIVVSADGMIRTVNTSGTDSTSKKTKSSALYDKQ